MGEISLKRAAMAYIQQNGQRPPLPIFPLSPRSKTPCAGSGGFKDGTTDAQTVRDWWTKTPEANVGLWCRGLVVLDIDRHDPAADGLDSLRELEREHGELPETWIALTPTGGEHIYFRCDDPKLTTGAAIRPGIDYRGAGGYVVLPPSVHPSGGVYAWDAGHTPNDTPLAPLPEWLHEILLKTAKAVQQKEVPPSITKGERNATLFKLASSLRAKGLTETEIYAALSTANQERCNPPLPDSEIRSIASSSAKYERGAAFDQTAGDLTLATISAEELARANLPPIRFVVENLLPHGLALIASLPKFGKSWLSLLLCVSAALGSPFLGFKTNRCRCLYLALEDSKQRLQSRLKMLLDGRKAPGNFDFAVACHALDDGLIDELDGYTRQHADVGLIVIDTLQKVRGAVHGRESAYSADYREMAALKAFADSHNVALVLVHHLRKMGDDGDPFNRISGTNGIFGAADTAIVLTREKRRDAETIMSIVGRDVESAEIVLRFDKDTGEWINDGDTEAVAERRALEAYKSSGIVRTVKKLLSQAPDGQWTGTSTELLNAGRYITRSYISSSARSIAKDLKAMDRLLLENDGIIHSVIKNGTGGGKHHFEYRDKDPFVELPEDENVPFI